MNGERVKEPVIDPSSKVCLLINAERVLLLISSTLFLSYLSGIIYNRTKIPDIVWLLLFGMVLGPGLKVFNAEIFLDIFDLMLLVTVALFAFSTGLNFNIQHLLGNTARAFNMAIVSFMTTSVVVGFTLRTILPTYFNFVTGLLLGAMIAGIDGVSISSLVNSLSKDSKEMGLSGAFLQLESTLADPIKVVGVLTIIKMVTLTGAGPRTAIRDIVFTLLFATIIGVGAGLIWGEILSRLRDRPLNYMLTIATLFPIYVLSEMFSGGGGGPISVFLFGVVMMNYSIVTKSLQMKKRSRIDRRKIREYHDEITFLMKAMFFVYLGLIVTLDVRFFAVGVLLTMIIILVRYITASILGRAQGVPNEEMAYTRFFFIQGAGSLVLTQFVTKYDPTGANFPSPEIFTNIVVPVVLMSILFTSVVAPLLAHRQTHPRIHDVEAGLGLYDIEAEPDETKKNGKNEEKS
jgi:NhaP-type Na+/H+ or K+/H+ antiporter